MLADGPASSCGHEQSCWCMDICGKPTAARVAQVRTEDLGDVTGPG